ncbi:MAG: hypothetical protein L0219_09775, partial [Phycisphaerales bacterium]|nr:hypothetical protein [Phycisphaerales bacterium]
GIEVLDHPAIQRHVLNRARERELSQPHAGDGNGWSLVDFTSNPVYPGFNGGGNGGAQLAHAPSPLAVAEAFEPLPVRVAAAPQVFPWHERATAVNTNTMGALGWERFHVQYIESIAEEKKEQIGSLGWDGPLAAMSQTRVNLADFFKETVAVVTNPSIDRERERAQFSTQTLIGVRPLVGQMANPDDLIVKLETPLLLGGHPDLGSLDDMRVIADKNGTMTIEDLVETFGDRAAWLSMSAAMDETIEAAIERLQQDAVDAVINGVQCLILDDTDVYNGERLFIDPLLAAAAIDKALRLAEHTPNLRRHTGLVVRSGALRDLHDLALVVALGANAVLPYAMYAVAIGIAPRAPKERLESTVLTERFSATIKIMTAGLQKVTSTIGCHELRGY